MTSCPAPAATAARRDAILLALRTHMPQGVSWSEPEGGFFVWVMLPAQLDVVALLRRAVAEAKVGFVPGTAFFPDGSGRNMVRLSFSLNDEATTEQGIARLAHLVRDALARA